MKQLYEEQGRKYGDKTAFSMREVSGYRKISYAQVVEIVAKLQAVMARRGIVPGDRVALISENRPEWSLSYLAITGMGAIVVPLDAMLRQEEILPLIEDSEPKLMICTQKYAEYVKQKPLKGGILLMEEFNQLPAVSEKVNHQVKPDDLAAIVYTSGTTGIPKGVMLSHRNILSDVYMTLRMLDIDDKDIFLSVLPLHHTFETSGGFFGAFCSGATIVYAESLKAHALLQNMQDNGITVICGVPLLFQLFWEGVLREVEEKKMLPVFRLLLAISGFFRRYLGLNIGRQLFGMVQNKFGGRIRFFLVGGAPLNKQLIENYNLMGFLIVQGYGMTEASPIITANSNRPKGNRNGAVGKIILGTEGRIDEKTGEILVKGPNVMRGYYKRQHLTDEVIIDGWLHTGDLGYMDKDGFLYINGRLKDVIVTSGGNNVYPDEIEAKLDRLPPIKESCVLGEKVKEGIRKGSEQLAAVVVVREGHDEEQAKKAIEDLNKNLAEYKRIAKIYFRKEELPRTRLLKIKRFAVKKEMGL
jgi:long-chain acyl-CoA synthetase